MVCWPPLFFEHLNLLLTITGRWSDISEDLILTSWRYYGWLPQMWSRPVFQRLCISSGQALYYPAPFAMLFFFRYCNKVVHNEQLVWQRLTIRNNQSSLPLLPLTFATACSFLSYFHIGTYFNFLFHFSCSLEDEFVVLSVSKEVQELVRQPLYFILIPLILYIQNLFPIYIQNFLIYNNK